jgi:hypothetical protein
MIVLLCDTSIIQLFTLQSNSYWIFYYSISPHHKYYFLYLKEIHMEIIIGLVIIAGLAYVLTRKKHIDEVNAAPYKVETPEPVVEAAPVVAVAETPAVEPAKPKAAPKAKTPRAPRAKAPAKPKAVPAKPKAPAKPRARKPAAPK